MFWCNHHDWYQSKQLLNLMSGRPCRWSTSDRNSAVQYDVFCMWLFVLMCLAHIAATLDCYKTNILLAVYELARAVAYSHFLLDAAVCQGHTKSFLTVGTEQGHVHT